jgi:hypothetical protein
MAKGQKTGGRKKGTPNKATRELRELAHEYCPAALKELVRIATKGESDSARVAAIKEPFDRAYGKATQAITAKTEQTITVNTDEIRAEIERKLGRLAKANAEFESKPIMGHA